MRYVYAFVCLVLALFAIVQYNDPDALLWILIYGIAAAVAGYAAWRPEGVRRGPGRSVLLACLAVAVALTVYYWPTAPGFWQQEVWWDDESAREGMGMMIVTVGLLIVALPVLLRRG